MSLQNTQSVTSATLGNITIDDGRTSTGTRSPVEIQAWMVSYLAQLLEVDPDEILIDVPFDHYGLDSAVAVGMTGDLEDWLNQKLDPTLLYDYPTIASLSQHLSRS